MPDTRFMKEKTKFRIMIAVFACVTLVGALFAMIPLFRRVKTERMISREIDRYNEIVLPAIRDYGPLWALIDGYNASLRENDSQFFTTDAENEIIDGIMPQIGNIIGYVSIPKIDVSLPLYRGLDESVLQAGAGWWPGSSFPAGGQGTHTVISAHSGMTKAKMFTDLGELSEGDVFRISLLDRDLYYTVDQIKTVTPDDISDLYIIPGGDYATLYTCTPLGVNSHRLLVRGVRTDAPAEEEPIRVTADAYIDKGVIAVMAAASVTVIVLAALAAAAGISGRKRRNGKG